MGLSDDEQMLLQQIEQSLMADDPRLTRDFHQSMGAPLIRGRMAVAGIVVIVIGLVTLIGGGIVAGITALGVGSFVGMFIGAYMVFIAVEPWRTARSNPLLRLR